MVRIPSPGLDPVSGVSKGNEAVSSQKHRQESGDENRDRGLRMPEEMMVQALQPQSEPQPPLPGSLPVPLWPADSSLSEECWQPHSQSAPPPTRGPTKPGLLFSTSRGSSPGLWQHFAAPERPLLPLVSLFSPKPSHRKIS